MTKGFRTISLDVELIDLVKTNEINLSQEVNEYLKNRFSILLNMPNENKKASLEKMLEENKSRTLAVQKELDDLNKKEQDLIKAKDEAQRKRIEALFD